MTATRTSGWTLTFYAYKGGTGRTLALANVARYMAEVQGYRIGLVDLDIESPGLAYEPLSSRYEESRGALAKEIDGREGFIDLFLNQFGQDSVPRFGIKPSDLDRCVMPIEGRGDGGIVLMPTAKESLRLSPENRYSDTLAKFSDRLNKTSDEHIGKLTQALLQEFIRHYDLDFLFLDGRTGTGPFFPFYAFAVPQALVLLFALNEQNILGSLDLLRAKAQRAVEPAPALLVASPVPTVGPQLLEERLGVVEAELVRLREERKEGLGSDPAGSRYIYELPSSVSFMLPYSDLAAYKETYFPERFPHASLSREYRRLAEAIEAMVLKQKPIPKQEELATIHLAQLRRWRESIGEGPLVRIAAENVNYSHFLKFFGAHFGYSEVDFHEDTVEGTSARRLTIGRNGDIDFQIDLWPSEDADSPWEILASGKALQEYPDVLLVPQVYLGELARSERTEIPLSNLTMERLKWTETTRPPIFQYDFLDRYYPGWRRWCTLDSRVMAVPFSVNTMLLCANDALLPDLCGPYWQSKQQRVSPRGGCFLPSSWTSLLNTIREFHRLGPTDREWEPFRMVLHRRGLYYEWLNIVLALGGADIREGEGRIVEGVGISDDSVRDATEFLRDLAAATAGTEIRMDDQIEAFGLGKLALYVAWTDSFRFEVGEQESPIVTIPGRSRPNADLRIRLGQLPRDVNNPRRSVVDGWLMVFPRTGKDRQRTALEFASAFLDPDAQTEMLRAGFPTASLWAVQKELDGLGPSAAAQEDLRKRNYAVFLSVLKAAITDGHWVPSPDEGQDVNAVIQAGLRQVLEKEGADVKETLRAVEERVKILLAVAEGSYSNEHDGREACREQR